MNQQTLIVQEPVTRSQSLRHQLSQMSWSRGVANFFLEMVPFAYSTSQLFATQIATMIDSFYEASTTKKTPFHMVECGAGLGLLTKNILDVMAHKMPLIKTKCRTHVSDFSEETIQKIKSTNIFEQHEANVQLDVLDFCNPTFTDPPSVVLIAYLIDSMDTRHIEVKNGKIYELYIQSEIEPNARLIDFTQLPPTVLDATAIKTLLMSDDQQKKRQLLSNLSDLITEKWVPIPIEETSMEPEERQAIEAYVESLDSKGASRFNFSYAGYKGLCRTFEALEEEAMVLAYDFGDTSPTYLEPEHLIETYGAVLCYNVPMPLLSFAAKQYGMSHYHTQFTHGHSQMSLFTKGLSIESLKPTFESCFFQVEAGQATADAIREIKQLPDQKQPFLQKIEPLINSLSDLDRQSHSLLMTMVLECHKRELDKEAIGYAKQALLQYGATSLSTYHILGEIYQQTGEYDKALECLTHGLSFTTEHAGLYYQMSLIYGKTNQLDLFIDAVEKYLACNDRVVLWEHYITLALVFLQKDDKNKATELLDWVIQTNGSHPDLLPHYLIKKAQNIKAQFI